AERRGDPAGEHPARPAGQRRDDPDRRRADAEHVRDPGEQRDQRRLVDVAEREMPAGLDEVQLVLQEAVPAAERELDGHEDAGDHPHRGRQAVADRRAVQARRPVRGCCDVRDHRTLTSAQAHRVRISSRRNVARLAMASAAAMAARMPAMTPRVAMLRVIASISASTYRAIDGRTTRMAACCAARTSLALADTSTLYSTDRIAISGTMTARIKMAVPFGKYGCPSLALVSWSDRAMNTTPPIQMAAIGGAKAARPLPSTSSLSVAGVASSGSRLRSIFPRTRL